MYYIYDLSINKLFLTFIYIPILKVYLIIYVKRLDPSVQKCKFTSVQSTIFEFFRHIFVGTLLINTFYKIIYCNVVRLLMTVYILYVNIILSYIHDEGGMLNFKTTFFLNISFILQDIVNRAGTADLQPRVEEKI